MIFNDIDLIKKYPIRDKDDYQVTKRQIEFRFKHCYLYDKSYNYLIAISGKYWNVYRLL